VTVLLSLCLRRPSRLFEGGSVVGVFRDALAEHLQKRACEALAYCFMPDHLHLVVRGLRENADAWLAMVRFKRDTGEWMRAAGGTEHWQRGFDARFLHPFDDVEAACRYVLGNPVRAGLVEGWREYPYSGAIRREARGPAA
jgi:putative transposase